MQNKEIVRIGREKAYFQWCVDPQLLAQPQAQTRATLTAHLQQLLFHKSSNVFFFLSPVLFFLYQIYLKKAIKTTNNSDNNHNCTETKQDRATVNVEFKVGLFALCFLHT